MGEVGGFFGGEVEDDERRGNSTTKGTEIEMKSSLFDGWKALKEYDEFREAR